jgi:GntR family transcriptional regulator, transcriptional repressor for pyruvate dehydrogenase complex
MTDAQPSVRSASLTVDRKSLPERVAARLHELIRNGTYPSGSKLPHQRDLAADFDVSTAVIRESLALLTAGGVIRTRSGQGTFVADASEAMLRYPIWVGGPAGPDEIAEATEARDVLEHAIARLAAARRLPEDVVRLRACVERMAASKEDGDLFAAADTEFHLVLGEVARNRPLSGALSSLRGLIERDIVDRAHAQIAAKTIERTVVEHRAVVDAVEAGDANLAEERMEKILRHALEASGVQPGEAHQQSDATHREEQR